MATNLTAAQAALLARCGLQTQDQGAQSTELTYALNEGLNAYASEQDWWWLEDVDSFTTTAGTNAYAMPSDYKNTKNVFIGTTLLHPRQFQDMVRLEGQTAATPAYYTVHDETLYLSPAPSDSSTTVYHVYVRRESTLSTGTDTPLIPDRYVPLWLSFAAVYLADRLGNPKMRAQHERSRDEWLRRAQDEARAQRGLAQVYSRQDVVWNA